MELCGIVLCGTVCGSQYTFISKKHFQFIADKRVTVHPDIWHHHSYPLLKYKPKLKLVSPSVHRFWNALDGKFLQTTACKYVKAYSLPSPYFYCSARVNIQHAFLYEWTAPPTKRSEYQVSCFFATGFDLLTVLIVVCPASKFRQFLLLLHSRYYNTQHQCNDTSSFAILS
jgi:hypothetical protein